MQFLSEPSGGSDVAAALTTAVRDGDEWVVNGSKIWTTGAWFSDYGLCLLRTNWDVPKHRGLSVFIIKIHQPGIELHRIEMINGSREFCQEFMTDLRVPDSRPRRRGRPGLDRRHPLDVPRANAMGGGSPYVSGAAASSRRRDRRRDPLVELATQHRAPRRPARARPDRRGLHARPCAGRSCRSASPRAWARACSPTPRAAIARLMSAVVSKRNVTITSSSRDRRRAIAARRGDVGAGAGHELPRCARRRRIGGGTTEMARNNISERVLGMPREMTHDRNIPFRDVPKGPPSN